MNYSVFTVNKKIGAKTAKFDSKRSQKLKTARKQEINRKKLSFSEEKYRTELKRKRTKQRSDQNREIKTQGRELER
jgi:parvulin-like peptidyl-prolyl isomerase